LVRSPERFVCSGEFSTLFLRRLGTTTTTNTNLLPMWPIPVYRKKSWKRKTTKACQLFSSLISSLFEKAQTGKHHTVGNISRISSFTHPISMLLGLILFSFLPLLHSIYRTTDCGCAVARLSLPSWKVESSDVKNDNMSHPIWLLSLATLHTSASDPVVFLFLPLSTITFGFFLPPISCPRLLFSTAMCW
jgi:hypothetical protein